MPMYDYRCSHCDTEFEALRPMAERATAEHHCGGMGNLVLKNLPRIDPTADLPSQRDLWRRNAERRGRGADMTAANKTVDDEKTLRDAHAQRAKRGENPIINT